MRSKKKLAEAKKKPEQLEQQRHELDESLKPATPERTLTVQECFGDTEQQTLAILRCCFMVAELPPQPQGGV